MKEYTNETANNTKKAIINDINVLRFLSDFLNLCQSVSNLTSNIRAMTLTAAESRPF